MPCLREAPEQPQAEVLWVYLAVAHTVTSGLAPWPEAGPAGNFCNCTENLVCWLSPPPLQGYGKLLQHLPSGRTVPNKGGIIQCGVGRGLRPWV